MPGRTFFAPEFFGLANPVVLGRIPLLKEVVQINAVEIDDRTSIVVRPESRGVSISREDGRPLQVEVDWHATRGGTVYDPKPDRRKVFVEPVAGLLLQRHDPTAYRWSLAYPEVGIRDEIALNKFIQTVAIFTDSKQMMLPRQ
jgi:hypothetical protein